MPVDLGQYAAEQFCYLTTTGRSTGRLHEIEIWFALDGATLYMLAGNHNSDWVKNIEQQPRVVVRLRERIFNGHARVVTAGSAEERRARELVGPKYHEWQPGQPETGWTWTALPVAVDLQIS